MSNGIAELKQEVKVLKERVAELETDHGKMSIFLEAFDKRERDDIAKTREAVQTLVEALARSIHGAPHLSTDEQTRIKKLLGIG